MTTPNKTFHSFTILKQFDTHILLPQCDNDQTKLDLQFKRFSRQFNIDLAPKILFSKSLSVDEMIKSGVSNYLEF